MSSVHPYTLCFLVKGSQILLAMKKRGLGMGKWNGIGGKVDPGETTRQAAIRETKEEIGVGIHTFHKVAVIDFYFHHEPTVKHNVTAYIVDSWTGEPQETEEMRPQWFEISAIPYDTMWRDDAFWLPRVLQGEKLKGWFTFDENEHTTGHLLERLEK